MEPTAPLGSGGHWAQQEALGFLAKAEAKALLALQARRGPRENVAPLDPQAKTGSQGPWGSPDPLDLLGRLARMRTRGKWAPLGPKGTRATKGMRAHLDQQEYGVLWDTQAPREQMGLRDAGDRQASLGRKEMTE